jgi:hypothetical protein
LLRARTKNKREEKVAKESSSQIALLIVQSAEERTRGV